MRPVVTVGQKRGEVWFTENCPIDLCIGEEERNESVQVLAFSLYTD